MLWLAAGLPLVDAAAQPPTSAVLTVDAEPFAAQFGGADDQGRLLFTDESGQTRRVDAANLVRWGHPATAGRGTRILLAGDGLIVGHLLTADLERLSLDSLPLGQQNVAVEQVVGVVLQPPVDPGEAERFADRLRRAGGQRDRLWLTNGDELPGRVLKLDEQQARFDSELGTLELDLDKIVAVAFDPSLVRRPGSAGLVLHVGLRDGSRLRAKTITPGQPPQQVQLHLEDGAFWPVNVQDVVWLQTQGGAAVYLSDVKPAGYRHVPWLSLPWEWRADRSATGTRLRGGGRLYAKGLGMHSASRLTYLPDGKFRRFQAALAIDDLAAPQGSVEFRVYADGQRVYSSPIVRGGQPPLEISLDITNVKRLDLLVDFADYGDTLDRANWLDARLLP